MKHVWVGPDSEWGEDLFAVFVDDAWVATFNAEEDADRFAEWKRLEA